MFVAIIFTVADKIILYKENSKQLGNNQQKHY